MKRIDIDAALFGWMAAYASVFLTWLLADPSWYSAVMLAVFSLATAIYWRCAKGA